MNSSAGEDAQGAAAGWRVGDVAITTVVERENEVAAADFIPSATGISQLRFVIQAVGLAVGGRKILVDTCIGARPLPDVYAGLANDGSFLDALAAAGFGRDDVDLVICTHLHFDHVGWNTVLEYGRWVPTFRRARYAVARPEYEHWSAASEELRAASNVHGLDDALLPLMEAGVVDLVDAGHAFSDAIRLVPAPGHTPGHVCVAIASRGERALITGDCAHHPTQLERPEWYSVADGDPAMACATRERLVRDHADAPVLIVGTHFPSPSAGYLVTTDGGVRFQPAPPSAIA